MFEHVLISKKEIGRINVILKNPFGQTCEKIIQTPRVFARSQVKDAIGNISICLTKNENSKSYLLDLPLVAAEYMLTDFFLYMHQTGLYNRQFELWRTLGNVRQLSIFKLQKGLLRNKKDLDFYLIDFFIDIKIPSIRAIISENKENNCKDFKSYLKWSLTSTKALRIKGIVYFTNNDTGAQLKNHLASLIKNSDPISKYESIINSTNDVRLNIIGFKMENEKYYFSHIYPELKSVRVE